MAYELPLRIVVGKRANPNGRRFFSTADLTRYVNIADYGKPYRFCIEEPDGKPGDPIPEDWVVTIWSSTRNYGYYFVETDYFDRASGKWKYRKPKEAKNEKNRKVRPAARGTDDRGTAVHRLGSVDHERGRRLTHEEVRAKYEDAFLKATRTGRAKLDHLE